MKRVIPVLSVLYLLLAPSHSYGVGNCGKISTNESDFDKNLLGNEEYTALVVDLLNDTELLPGVAIAIVKEDRLIYNQGFGFSNLDTCSEVTPDTGFYLLSTTKSFVGLLAALLHEDDSIQLDDSLADVFPGLDMPEPLNTAQITTRQLLTHGAAFTNGGLNFLRTVSGEMSKKEELRLLSKHSKPRPSGFHYSNLGYNIAGLIFEESTGESWRDLLEQRVFAPLGMTASTAYMNKALARDFARRYSKDENYDFFEVPSKLEAQMHPAGGSVSTTNDLSRWVIAQLQQGRLDGVQIFPEKVVRQALAPQIQFDWKYQSLERFAYGLGVHHADYDGDLLIHHFGGGIHVSFMPEHQLGVIVLTNNVASGGLLSHRIGTLTYDILLEKPHPDGRIAALRTDVGNAISGLFDRWAESKEAVNKRRNADDPMHDIESILGVYTSDRLGSIEVFTDSGHPTIRYGVTQARMTRLDGDSFTVLFDDLDSGVPQVLDFQSEGNSDSLNWDGRIYVKQ